MQIYHLAKVFYLEVLAFFGFGESCVIKAIAEPADATEFNPLNVIAEQSFGGYIHHKYFVPVASANRNGISTVFTIFGEAEARKAGGAIVRELIRVDKENGLCIEVG